MTDPSPSDPPSTKLQEKEELTTVPLTTAPTQDEINAIFAQEIAQLEQNKELAAAEKEAQEAQENEEEKVSAFQLFQFADSTDKLLMGLGTLAALLNGASQPLMTIIFCTPFPSLVLPLPCSKYDWNIY